MVWIIKAFIKSFKSQASPFGTPVLNTLLFVVINHYLIQMLTTFQIGTLERASSATIFAYQRIHGSISLVQENIKYINVPK